MVRTQPRQLVSFARPPAGPTQKQIPVVWSFPNFSASRGTISSLEFWRSIKWQRFRVGHARGCAFAVTTARQIGSCTTVGRDPAGEAVSAFGLEPAHIVCWLTVWQLPLICTVQASHRVLSFTKCP